MEKDFLRYIRKNNAVHRLVGKIACLGFGVIALTAPFSLSALKASENSSPSEIESLRQQLYDANRELNKYKTHLFRSTHPEDKTKITQLSQQLAQQKELNHQLSEAIQMVEKDLVLARKESGTTEITIDALSAMVQKQRQAAEALEKEYKSQLDQTISKAETAKKLLVAELLTYSLEKQQQLALQVAELYEERQLAQLIANTTENALLAEIQQLHQQMNEERLQMVNLSQNLQTAAELLISFELHSRELEEGHRDATELHSHLSSHLMSTQDQHESTKQALSHLSAMAQMEKKALAETVRESKEALETKIAELDALNSQLSDMQVSHEFHSSWSQASEQQLEDALNEGAMLKFALADLRQQAEASQEMLSHLFATLTEESLQRFAAEESAVAMLDDLVSALDYVQASEQAQQNDHEYALTLSQHEQKNLTAENSQLKKENASLAADYATAQYDLTHYYTHLNEKLKEALLEKEEALAATLMYHQTSLEEEKENSAQRQARVDQQQHEHALSQATSLFHFQTAVESLFSQVQSLQNALTEEQRQHSLIQASLDIAADKQGKEQEQVSQLNTDLANALNDVSMLKENLRFQQEQLQASEMQLQQLEETSSLKIAELQVQFSAQQDEQNTLRELQARMSELQKRAAEETAKWQAKIDQLQSENEIGLAASLFNSETIVESLYSQMKSLQNELTEEQRQHTLIQTSLDIALEKQEKEKERASQLHQDLDKALTDISMLKEDLHLNQNKLEIDMAALQEKSDADNTQWQAKMDQLQSEHETSVATSLYNYETVVEGLNSHLQSLQNELAEARKQHSSIQAALDIAVGKQEEESGRSAQLHNDLDKALSDISMLKEDLRLNQDKLQASEMQMQQLEHNAASKFAELQSQFDAQSTQKTHLQQHLDALTFKHLDAKEHNKDLERTVQELVTRLKEKEQSESQLIANLEELESANSDLRQSLTQAVSQNYMSEKRISSLSEHLEQLTTMQGDRQAKEQELEQKLTDFSNLAEEQSLSLAETQRMLRKTREFSQMLTEENDRLKEHLTRIVATANKPTTAQQAKAAEQSTGRWTLPGLAKWLPEAAPQKEGILFQITER